MVHFLYGIKIQNLIFLDSQNMKNDAFHINLLKAAFLRTFASLSGVN